MINIDQIFEQYPDYLRIHKESILKEYLQCKILYSIFESKYSSKLSFLGGTALRLLYNNTRFSEDLDFDNFDISEKEFIDLGEIIKKDLEKEGLEVEIQAKTRQAYRLKIRIPRLLFDLKFSPLETQKILIQVDTVPQSFDYTPEDVVFNKFEIFTRIKATPKDILLAQKIYTLFNRNRIMGRDFFDIVFLYGIGARPNFYYLNKSINVKNDEELKDYFLKNIKGLNFDVLAKDVEPSLFNPKDKNKVLFFEDFAKKL